MTGPVDIKRAIREQLYARKFDNQVEMDQFLEKHMPKLTQLEIHNLNMPISNKAIESTMNNLTGYPTAAGSRCPPTRPRARASCQGSSWGCRHSTEPHSVRGRAKEGRRVHVWAQLHLGVDFWPAKSHQVWTDRGWIHLSRAPATHFPCC